MLDYVVILKKLFSLIEKKPLHEILTIEWRHHPLRPFLYAISRSKPELFEQFSKGDYTVPTYAGRGGIYIDVSPAIVSRISACADDIPLIIQEIQEGRILREFKAQELLEQ